MRLNCTQRIRYAGVAAVLAPLMAVGVSRLTAPPGPTPAMAQGLVDTAVADAIAATPRATPAQRAALMSIRETIDEPFGVSPFYQPQVAPRQAAVDEPEADETLDPPPRALLTSIMSGRETIAMINGVPRRVGQEIAPGWRIKAIHAATRKVTLVHDDGREHDLSIERR